MRRLAFAIGAVAIGFAATSGSGFASDYSHSCSTADGLYKMWDEELTEANDPKNTPIKYTTIKDTVLSQRAGHCLSKGQKFGFEAKTYVRKIKLNRDGAAIEIELLCEMASDGLPAAFTCDKEVVTLDSTTGAAAGGATPDNGGAATTALWNHNGSVMRLEASGTRRVFSYQNPRPGMRKAGAKPGDVVFEGTRDGNTYAGTAYVFSAGCGRTGYAVAGNVIEGERGVSLEGQVPLLDGQCKITSYKRDTLRFDYVAR